MSKQLLIEFVRRIIAEERRKPLDLHVPDDVKVLAKEFKANGHKLYVVGGAVRDALMGKKPKDVDVATDATPDRVIAIVSRLPGHKVIEVGKSFGVVKVVAPSGDDYEIATFRRDIGSGRRPEAVEFADIETDAQRRDLTINALYYDIDTGEVVDHVGGLEDVERGVVRSVGDPAQRFGEDRLRVLRALRFAARLGSELDPATSAAIEDDNSLVGVSPERIRDEFLKGVKSAKTLGGFLSLIDRYEMWDQIFPGLKITKFSGDTRNVPVLLALLLVDNEPGVIQSSLNRLKYSAEEALQVSFLVRMCDLAVDNAFKLKKSFANTKLSVQDLHEFAQFSGAPDEKLLSAFVQFNPLMSPGDLISKGFKGPLLGREIERRETQKFKDLL